MLYFENDYSEGAHEEVLKRLTETNMEQLPGYGTDRYTASAKEKICAACGCPDAEVYLLTGGTQTNQIVISSIHKVLTLPQTDGKISASDLEEYLSTFYGDENHEHMVFPGMVYISHPTEYGTLYTKGELAELSAVCSEYRIPLYLDGARLGYALAAARLGYALAAADTDVTLQDVAEYCDVFYIGGTKVGALCGEAVVFPKENTPFHFVTKVKQRGALLAKGRLTGIQFDALFTDDLYLKIGKNAIDTANELKRALREKGYEFFIDSPTNQIFVVLEDAQMDRLKEYVVFSYWEKKDDTHTVVRFATSWATKMEDVKKLAALL